MAEETIAQVAGACTPHDEAAKKKAYQRAYYLANRERKIAAYQANRAQIRAKQAAHYASHRDEARKRNSAYYAANRDAVLRQKREHYAANKEKFAARDREFRARNAAKIAEKDRERRPQKNAARAARYKSSPEFRLRMTVSVGMNQSIKTGKGGKAWESLVGYTVEDLMRHLERQFSKGMTRANYGKWHLDHVQPLASFQITGVDCPEFRAAWALTNLRPLWAAENLSKNARRTLLL